MKPNTMPWSGSCFVCSFPARSPLEHRTTLWGKGGPVRIPKHQSLGDQPRHCSSKAENPWVHVNGSFTKCPLRSWFPSSPVMSWQESKCQETRCQKGLQGPNLYIPNLCWITRMHAVSITYMGSKCPSIRQVSTMLPALDPHSPAPKMALKKCPLASSHVSVSAHKFQIPGYCEDASVTKLQATHTHRECGSSTTLSSRVWIRLQGQLQG